MTADASVRLLNDSSRSLAVKGLSELLASHDDIYPGIEAWFSRQVVPGLASGDRKVWVIENAAEQVTGEAILKLRRPSAKLCSMYIPEGLRRTGLASRVLREVVGCVQQARIRALHFTIAEDSAEIHGGFFERIGFRASRVLARRYRVGANELLFRAETGACQ